MSIQGIICISDLDECGKYDTAVCDTCGLEFKNGAYYKRHVRSCGVKFAPRESYEEMVGNL